MANASERSGIQTARSHVQFLELATYLTNAFTVRLAARRTPGMVVAPSSDPAVIASSSTAFGPGTLSLVGPTSWELLGEHLGRHAPDGQSLREATETIAIPAAKAYHGTRPTDTAILKCCSRIRTAADTAFNASRFRGSGVTCSMGVVPHAVTRNRTIGNSSPASKTTAVRLGTPLRSPTAQWTRPASPALHVAGASEAPRSPSDAFVCTVAAASTGLASTVAADHTPAAAAARRRLHAALAAVQQLEEQRGGIVALRLAAARATSGRNVIGAMLAASMSELETESLVRWAVLDAAQSAMIAALDSPTVERGGLGVNAAVGPQQVDLLAPGVLGVAASGSPSAGPSHTFGPAVAVATASYVGLPPVAEPPLQRTDSGALVKAASGVEVASLSAGVDRRGAGGSTGVPFTIELRNGPGREPCTPALPAFRGRK